MSKPGKKLKVHTLHFAKEGKKGKESEQDLS